MPYDITYDLADAKNELARHHRDFEFISHQAEMIESTLQDATALNPQDENIKAALRRIRKIRNTVG